MSDDNIIGINGRQAVELRADQAEREAREEILRQKLKCEGLELRPGNAPGTYTIAHPNPPQPPYLNGWRDLSLEQVEDATGTGQRPPSPAAIDPPIAPTNGYSGRFISSPRGTGNGLT